MKEKPKFALSEIKKHAILPDYTKEVYEIEATISDDKKSLLLRIPAKVRDQFKLKKGDKMVFKAKETDPLTKLEIRIDKK